MWFPLLLLCPVAFGYVDYSGDVVLRVTASDYGQLEMLQNLENKGYDLWHEARDVGGYTDVHVPQDRLESMKTWLQEGAFEYRVMIEDVGTLINKQLQTRDTPKDPKRLDFYRTLEEVEQYMENVSSTYPELVTLSTIATSYEGRNITVMKISTGGDDKPVFWVDSGIHSREWVAISTTLYYIDQLVTGYGNDQEITNMLDTMDWYILPVFNVDGYEYTWTEDRLWRKTRSPNDGSICMGTDPNRNWNIKWNTVGAGGPCTQTFPGDFAFSEIEVAMVADFMSTLDIRVVMAIHSYSQMYMTPYGYTRDNPADFEEQMDVCNEANEALRAVHGMVYRCNSLTNLVGPNSGSSVDYTYDVLGIKLSYGVELRDTGVHGFLLPEDQIIPTAEENWAAMKVFARRAMED